MSEGTADVALDIDLTGGDLTLNEQAEVEVLCGGTRPFHFLQLEGTAVFHRAVALMVLRRTNPAVTLHQAGEIKAAFERG